MSTNKTAPATTPATVTIPLDQNAGTQTPEQPRP